MLKKLVLKRKEMLTGFLIAILLTACAGAVMIGTACEVYIDYRSTWPALELLPRPWLEWLNAFDAEMLKVCRSGGG